MTTLYNLHTDGSGHRITKFVDGEVESSYLTTAFECECPAGHRPSCRHRQMLPQMLATDIANTHWFYNFDSHRVVDFDGMLKSNFDAMNELADRKIGATIEDFEREHSIMPVGEATNEHPNVTSGLFAREPDEAYLDCDDQAPPVQLATRKSWRRL